MTFHAARLPLAFAAAAIVAAMLASPGLYLALGFGIAATGTGWMAFRSPRTPGASRLGGAAAIALGGLGFTLGAIRVALTLAALGHLDRMLG
jgi:hypothetical protein